MEPVGAHVTADVKSKAKKMTPMNLLTVAFVPILCSFKVHFAKLKLKKD